MRTLTLPGEQTRYKLDFGVARVLTAPPAEHARQASREMKRLAVSDFAASE